MTRQVADTLAQLAASLEKDGHHPELIAAFLQRLLFTLFAEDVGLLPEKSFETLLTHAAGNPAGFTPLITTLWQDMARGSDFSTAIMQKVLHFNGGFFENPLPSRSTKNKSTSSLPPPAKIGKKSNPQSSAPFSNAPSPASKNSKPKSSTSSPTSAAL